MPGKLEFGLSFGQGSRNQVPRGDQDPMRILLIGDFSGRDNRGLQGGAGDLGERPVVAVDIDNFDQVMSRFAPRLGLGLIGPERTAVDFQFGELEDFHPDALYDHSELFQALKDLRRRLVDPQTFARAAAELRQTAREQPQEPTGERGAEPAVAEDDASMFERLLGGQPTQQPRQQTAAGSGAIDELIKQVVAPYVVPEADPFQDQYVASVDQAISEQMRALLHHPDFQALEANWRSLHGLVTGLETNEDLKLYVLDASKAELAADIEAAKGDQQASGLHRRLVERGVLTPGGEPWSLLLGCYRFGASVSELSLLAALGAIASRAGGPFLAAADPSLLGSDGLDELARTSRVQVQPMESEAGTLWGELRKSPMARWLGLALPRVLLRLPYGKDTEAIERFDFEEVGSRDHENYLWGNPAFACALLIGQAFTSSGWGMTPGDYLDIEDLPAFTYDEDGEPRMQPCAEFLLSEKAGEAILSRGLMPLLSYRNRNAVRVLRLQSIAEPAAPLEGAWA